MHSSAAAATAPAQVVWEGGEAVGLGGGGHWAAHAAEGAEVLERHRAGAHSGAAPRAHLPHRLALHLPGLEERQEAQAVLPVSSAA